MSAQDDNQIICNCLAAGAKDFIVKPLRVQECRGLEQHIKEPKSTEAEKNLGKYEILKMLGRGAAGQVELVKNKVTDQEYALKTIPLAHLSQSERKLAESEVQFLKVLIGPTLIKSYASYVEKDKIYIIMEYAEGGNLSEKIHQHKKNKEKFDADTILKWISQIILGVMLMHSKNILHRDLKSQNLFLTKANTIKIGDFGISKELSTMNDLAQTSCGTPYFMPPEVCKGEKYGEKADIWAIGCILYELAVLKKPFDSDSIHGVFNLIIN